MASPAALRPFVFLSTFLLFLTSLPSAFGQVSKVKSAYDQGEEKDLDRPDLREQWFANGRTAPPGESRAALRLRAHQQKLAMRAQREAAAEASGAEPAATSSAGWTSLGPAPLDSNAGFQQDYNLVSGRAIAVAIDPADTSGNTVFVGGAFGGLWKSVNGADPSGPGAVVWQPLLDNQPSLAVGAVALQPGNSNLILVGTGEANSAGDSYYGVGILRSTDGGITWSQPITAAQTGQSFLGIGFTKIAFSSQKPNLVVAATAGDIGFNRGREEDGNATARGLYSSQDGGQTWSRVTLTDNAVPASATDVVFNASQGANGTFYAFIRHHGLYSSSDGVNWTPLAIQPYSGINSSNCPTASNSGSCPIYRGELAVLSGSGRNEIYAWVEDEPPSGSVDHGIYQSVNGGSSWNQTENPANSGITNCGDNAFGPGHSGCGVQQGFYNLELGAVPNGSGTDLYAGAVNLWKCSLPSGSSTCSSSANWINLTHVYGCNPLGAPARVHPDEHGIAFMVASGKAVGYFANDGGIYRTLDAFTELNSGSCTPGINGFDSLNQTLGSMTQFVSFSVDPTNQNNVLGGTQDNGSPKTATATTSQAWASANGGDGGYNIINPDQVNHPNEWFTANTYVSIQVCEQGENCNGPAFGLVVDNTTIGGDEGPFYTPYILDPRNSSELLVGTCRVWEGTTSGTNFNPLNTLSFDNTGVPCTGSETDLTRSLAAGGPVDPGSQLSKVVYATTTGTGPLASAPAGGEVWVTTAGGKMSPVTGSINPSHYTISSVVIDTADASGQTAYVGIMGFVGDAGSHIWKTADAGGSWTTFGSVASGLPDAPVNALLVDSEAGQVYAGSDVGIFVSPTSSPNGPNWTEVEPVPGSGQGYLPSVPVTAIQLFNYAGTKKLRVSTYGRGIWEYPLATAPDYQITISNTPQTVLQNQTVTFNGTLTALNNYNNAVTLSCGAGAPGSCTFPGNPITPTLTGAPFTVSMPSGNVIQNYTFNIHGTDGTLSHDFSVTVNVTDFSLGTPNPATVTVVQGGTSNATQYQLGSLGPFNGTVGLSCSAGLPPGASCNFSPASQINLNPANPSATMSTTVTAAPSTPVGSYPVTISAATAGEAAKTQTFTLQVTAPDFQWTGGGSHQVLAGQVTLSYSFTATPSGGTFASNVTFACASLPALTHCSFNPPSIPIGTPGAQPVAITISTTGPNPGIGPVNRRTGNRDPWLPLTAPIAGVMVVGVMRRRMRRQHATAVLSLYLALLGLLLSCGGGGGGGGSGPPPPPPQISVTVTLMAGQPPSLFPNDGADGWPAQTAQFQATVNNSSNQAVTWAVVGGDANGTIDANGVYTSPTVAPGLPGSATITATAQADTSKSGSAVETLTPATLPGTYNNISVSAADNSGTFSNPVTLIVQ